MKNEISGCGAVLIIFFVFFVFMASCQIYSLVEENQKTQRYVHDPDLQAYLEKVTTEKPVNGVKQLPEKLRGFAVGGNCCVTVKNRDLILVFFPIEGGMWDGLGYVYTSRPLRSSDYEPKTNEGTEPEISAGTIQGASKLSITLRCSPHWYQIKIPFN